ncbi:MAG TPA: hypothetical protein VK989_09980, partial [Polyangia bacterium]|nr:hypothetical protein [Polyangia bacterium]
MAAFHRAFIPVLGTLVICACSRSASKSGVSGSAGASGQAAMAGAAGSIAGQPGGAGAGDAGAAGAIGGTAGATSVDGGPSDDASEAGTSTDGATFPIGDPGTDGDGDLTISPPYTTQPELTDKGN